MHRRDGISASLPRRSLPRPVSALRVLCRVEHGSGRVYQPRDTRAGRASEMPTGLWRLCLSPCVLKVRWSRV